MNVMETISDGWRRHGVAPNEVAANLLAVLENIETPGERAAWAKLYAHLVGFEQGFPARALASIAPLAQRCQGPEDAAVVADAYLLSVVGGSNGVEWLMRLTAIDPANTSAWLVRNAALWAAHRLEAGDLRGANDLLRAVEAARALPPGNLAERTIAICCNNGVSACVEAAEIADAVRPVLLPLARASREFWQRVGTPLNDARGAYLVQMTANALGDTELAASEGHAALSILESLEDVDVDRVFVRLELARTQRLVGGTYDLLALDAATTTWDAGLRTWYEETRRRYFGPK